MIAEPEEVRIRCTFARAGLRFPEAMAGECQGTEVQREHDGREPPQRLDLQAIAPAIKARPLSARQARRTLATRRYRPALPMDSGS